MFDFEKLEVYQRAKSFNKMVYYFVKSDDKIDTVFKERFVNASMNIMFNLSDGSSKFDTSERKKSYTLARGSVFECVILIDFFKEEKLLSEKTYSELYPMLDALSRMTLSLIRSVN